MRRHPRNAVFVGPTGCGKTEIWRTLSRVYPNIVIVDAGRFTAEGFKGDSKIAGMFTQLPKEEAEHGIYILDESDKMFEPHTTSAGEDVSISLQSELLKIIEGSRVQVSAKDTVDTRLCSFIFLGSFERMVEEKAKQQSEASGIGFGAYVKPDAVPTYLQDFTQEDLVSYANVRREVAGRIGTIVQLQPMGAEEFKKILDTPSMSPLFNLENEYHKSIVLKPEDEEWLCIEAEESKMGVRYIRSRITDEFDRQMFENPDAEWYVLFSGIAEESMAAGKEAEEKVHEMG